MEKPTQDRLTFHQKHMQRTVGGGNSSEWVHQRPVATLAGLGVASCRHHQEQAVAMAATTLTIPTHTRARTFAVVNPSCQTTAPGVQVLDQRGRIADRVERYNSRARLRQAYAACGTTARCPSGSSADEGPGCPSCTRGATTCGLGAPPR